MSAEEEKDEMFMGSTVGEIIHFLQQFDPDAELITCKAGTHEALRIKNYGKGWVINDSSRGNRRIVSPKPDDGKNYQPALVLFLKENK